jgi:hypothetical protein
MHAQARMCVYACFSLQKQITKPARKKWLALLLHYYRYSTYIDAEYNARNAHIFYWFSIVQYSCRGLYCHILYELFVWLTINWAMHVILYLGIIRTKNEHMDDVLCVWLHGEC